MIEIVLNIIEDFIRYISGPLGVRIRRLYYSKRLKKCGKGLVVDTGVFFSGPNFIEVGDNVWIDKNVHFIAGELNKQKIKVLNKDVQVKKGNISLGSNIHIGINTIIQGHGGVVLENYFTSSANCCIYSLSNEVGKCYSGTYNKKSDVVYYVQSPVHIEQNVWLGLGVKVLGGRIGSNTFVKPHSVVISSIEENSIAEGFPALRVKSRFPN